MSRSEAKGLIQGLNMNHDPLAHLAPLDPPKSTHHTHTISLRRERVEEEQGDQEDQGDHGSCVDPLWSPSQLELAFEPGSSPELVTDAVAPEARGELEATPTMVSCFD